MNEDEQRSLPRPWSSPTWGLRRSGAVDAPMPTANLPPAPLPAEAPPPGDTAEANEAGGAVDSSGLQGDARVAESAVVDCTQDAAASSDVESDDGSDGEWGALGDFIDDPELFDAPAADGASAPAIPTSTHCSEVLELRVPSIGYVTAAEFAERYRRQSPVLLASFASEWAACQRWVDNDHLAALSDAEAIVLAAPAGRKFLKCDCTQAALPFGECVRAIFGAHASAE
eukprot:6003660-Prymnesium_polylepis.1